MRTEDEILNDAHSFVKLYKRALNESLNTVELENVALYKSIFELNEKLANKSIVLINELAELNKDAGWWRKKVIKSYAEDILKARSIHMKITEQIINEI